MRKILVLRGGALGDFIVTLPALALLRRRWPEAQIELIGNASAAILARDERLLDTIHSQHEARWSALFGTAALPSALAAWLAEFDLVLNYWPDPEGELRARFPVRAGQRFLHAAAMPAQAPAAAHYCAPLCELGLETADYFFRFAVADRAGSPSRPEFSETSPAPGPTAHDDTESRPRTDLIAIHPGSGSPRKNWPAERWRELIASLKTPILLIVGEAENESWLAQTATPAAPVELAANLPLPVLRERLTRCRFFIGHDSGISHLAAACGVPSLLLFGPTDPAMWAPPASHVRVLRRGPDLNSISVADVRRELAAAGALRA